MLHIIEDSQQIPACLQLCSEQDEILMLTDEIEQENLLLSSNIDCYALHSSNLSLARLQKISYARWIELCVKHEKVVTWA